MPRVALQTEHLDIFRVLKFAVRVRLVMHMVVGVP